MLKLETIKENVLAFVLALFLAIIVLLIINNYDLFKADIYINPDAANSQQLGNLSYEFSGGSLYLYSEEDFEAVTTLSIIIFYDSEKLANIQELVDSNLDFTIATAGEGRVNMILTNVGNIKTGDLIMLINNVQDEGIVTFTDVQVNYTNGTNESLSISKKN